MRAGSGSIRRAKKELQADRPQMADPVRRASRYSHAISRPAQAGRGQRPGRRDFRPCCPAWVGGIVTTGEEAVMSNVRQQVIVVGVSGSLASGAALSWAA